MKSEHPKGNKKALTKFYTRQNELIDRFLGADDEERLQLEEDVRMGPRIKFAVYGSFSVNLCLFAIQLYAAVSTGSLAVSPIQLRLLHIITDQPTAFCHSRRCFCKFSLLDLSPFPVN